jgi:hypothetical protein
VLLAVLTGGAAVAFSVLYIVSDLIELVHGGFSTSQLVLTYAAEAAIPLFVLGLFGVQRPGIGKLGLVTAVAYSYTFVFFTSTVLYALVNHTRDWNELTTTLGAWVTVHSVLMVLAGVGFGVAVIRAHVLPRWTGITLIAGMVLMAGTAAMPDVTRTISAAVRDLAFAGMGAALLRRTLEPSIVMNTTNRSEPGLQSRRPDDGSVGVVASAEEEDWECCSAASSKTGSSR